MSDPYSSFEPPSPEPSPAQPSRSLLIWGGIAAAGALIILVMSCALVVLVLLPNVMQTGRLTLTTDPQTDPPPLAPAPPEELVPSGPVAIREDFAQPSPRWDQSGAQALDGSYELRLDTPDSTTYGLFLGSGGDIADFDMAVDAELVAGDVNAEYGIRFRQSGPSAYLLFSISGTGYYRLVRVNDQVYTELVPWTFHAGLETGLGAVNRLRMVADGDELTGSLNGDEVFSVTDEVGAAGQLTLGLGTFAQGELVVRFDNIAGRAEADTLDEDFSDPERVPWSIGGSRIRDGVYELFAGGGIQAWQQPLPQGSSEVENFVLEVDATLVNAGEDAAYGVLFSDGGQFDFYTLFILPEGGLMLLYSDAQGGVQEILPATLFDFVNPGVNASNRIRVEGQNGGLTITINDEELPRLRSPVPLRGRAGVIVSSGETGRVQVEFDNFRLEEVIDGDSAYLPSGQAAAQAGQSPPAGTAAAHRR